MYVRSCISSIECLRFFYSEGYKNTTIPLPRPAAAVQAEEVKQLEEALTCTSSVLFRRIVSQLQSSQRELCKFEGGKVDHEM